MTRTRHPSAWIHRWPVQSGRRELKQKFWYPRWVQSEGGVREIKKLESSTSDEANDDKGDECCVLANGVDTHVDRDQDEGQTDADQPNGDHGLCCLEPVCNQMKYMTNLVKSQARACHGTISWTWSFGALQFSNSGNRDYSKQWLIINGGFVVNCQCYENWFIRSHKGEMSHIVTWVWLRETAHVLDNVWLVQG